jgi:hypothetical protein
MPPNDNNRERPKQRQRTPEFAVENFDGEITQVHARQLIRSCCHKGTVNFIVYTSMLLSVMCFAVAMMIHVGFDGPGFTFYSGLFTFAMGCFAPAPKLKEPAPRN